MATSTTPKKKTASTTTAAKPRKPAAPKPVATAPVAPAQPLQAVQFTPVAYQPTHAPAKPVQVMDSDMQAEAALVAMNMVVRDEERVVIRTPHDPFNEQKLFERSINGLIIVLYADELYNLPKSIAKAIKKQVRIQELSDMTHEEFTTKNGKFIG